MPTKAIAAFGNPTNAEILNAIRIDASNAYAERIPAADQGDITATIDALLEYRPAMNEFLDALVNRIGDVIFRSKIWTNPLAIFKRGMMMYGDTIEEVATQLLTAHRYDANCCYEDVWKCNPPDVMSNFHTINRQDYYELTITEPMLRRAFLNDRGLSDLVTRIMSTPYTSDYFDEYLVMKNLFTEYARTDGYYKVQVPDLTTALTVEQRQNVSMQITEAIRAYVGKLRFLSSEYNAGKMPTFTNPQDLVLFATPEFIAALDVNVIAFAFNASAADIPTRIITVDEIPIDGAQAILADKDFFLCMDTLIDFESIRNPKQISWNYWLHHHGLYSISRFVNAILFTTEAATSVTVPEITINSVTVKAYQHNPMHCSHCHHDLDLAVSTKVSPSTVVTGVSGGQESPATATTASTSATSTVTHDDFMDEPAVMAGHDIRMVAIVDGKITPETSGYHVPQGVVWSVTGIGEPAKPLKTGTYIDAEGVLHVDSREENKKLTVTAVTTYVDKNKPMSEQQYKTGSVAVTIESAPEPHRYTMGDAKPAIKVPMQGASEPEAESAIQTTAVKKTAAKKTTVKKTE